MFVLSSASRRSLSAIRYVSAAKMPRRLGRTNHPHRRRGVPVGGARRLLLGLPGIAEGRSYGMPSFLLDGRFFARFRDDETVLVLQLGTIAEREVRMQLDPRAFFFTEHYRHYPAVLIRLAEVPRALLIEVLMEARRQVAAIRAVRSRGKHAPARNAPARPRAGKRAAT